MLPEIKPLAPLTADEEARVRAWLTHIGETDTAIITAVLDGCRADRDARNYFTRRSEESELVDFSLWERPWPR